MHDDGYGRSADRALAVFGSLPEEKVIAEPFARKHRKTYARTVEVISASPARVEPICGAASYCGGCSFQHFDPVKQVEYKQEKLRLALDNIPPDEWLHPLYGPVREYRYRARLGVKFVEKKGRVLVGFREKMSGFIAEASRCEILAPPLDGLLGALSEMIASLDARARIPQIEVAVGEGEAALVFRHLDALSPADESALRVFGERESIHIYLQPGNPESCTQLFGAGVDRLSYTLPAFNLTFRFHPLDFIQVNPAINRKLVTLAMDLLAPAQGDTVLDLFCGIGNFTLPVASLASRVFGFEGAVASVERARENAGRNTVGNCEFAVVDLFKEDLDLPRFGANKVLLDPPRSGAERVCQGLATHKVERVVYVSCNPQTLARDARILVESGYRLDKAGVIDMFPHTTHVESIACFSA